MSTSFQNLARAQNARKSTGPKTEAGKKRSRQNSTTHGLAGKGLGLPAELAAEVERQRVALGAQIDHFDDHSFTMESEMVLARVRLYACRAARSNLVEHNWDTNRFQHVHVLARQLPRDPERIKLELETTAQGATWLVNRLTEFAEIYGREGEWTTTQHCAVLDLFGVPLDVRCAEPTLDHMADYRSAIDDEVARVNERIAKRLMADNELDRTLAGFGVPYHETRELRLLRRYEKEHLNTYMRLANELGLEVHKGPALGPEHLESLEEEVVETASESASEQIISINVSAEPTSALMTAPKAGDKPAPVTDQPIRQTGTSATSRDEAGDRSRGLEGSDLQQELRRLDAAQRERARQNK